MCWPLRLPLGELRQTRVAVGTSRPEAVQVNPVTGRPPSFFLAPTSALTN